MLKNLSLECEEFYIQFLNGGLNMTDYEKHNQGQPTGKKPVEEIDPDYVTGGADVVEPEEIEGLTQTDHLEPCTCGKFSPNEGGVCGKECCENCKHARKLSDDSKNTFCSVQPLPHFS